MSGPRIVSMVPSWTETLLRAGANVVGRTRFCIHGSSLDQATAVGGTKDVDWDKVKALQPDLLLLDREENPKWMSDLAPCPVLATHVTSVQTIAAEIEKIAARLDSLAPRAAQALRDYEDRWKKIAEKKRFPLANFDEVTVSLPGVIEWIVRPPSQDGSGSPPLSPSFAYLIWRDPWMAAGPGTFIASVLEHVGVPPEKLHPGRVDPKSLYPTLDLESLPASTILLFSSEPFPFAKFKPQLRALGRPAALVDGESFSWFGVRSLEFLERSDAP